MRDHATIAGTFWTRGTGKLLRGHAEAQVVAMYLMSCPAASMVGIFHIALPTLCHETGLTIEGAWKGLRRCFDVGFCEYDEGEELVWVPNLARYQVGEVMKPGDKRKAGVIRSLRPFHRHPFYGKFVALYGDAYGLVGGSPYSPPSQKSDAPPKPLQRGFDPDPVLDPDPDPDPESENGKGLSEVRLKGADPVGAATPITSSTIAFAMAEEYAAAAAAALDQTGFAVGRTGRDDLRDALTQHAPVGLSADELRARIRFSVTRFVAANPDPKFAGGYQPAAWAKWLNAKNGWTLSKPPPIKSESASREHPQGLRPFVRTITLAEYAESGRRLQAALEAGESTSTGQGGDRHAV